MYYFMTDNNYNKMKHLYLKYFKFEKPAIVFPQYNLCVLHYSASATFTVTAQRRDVMTHKYYAPSGVFNFRS